MALTPRPRTDPDALGLLRPYRATEARTRISTLISLAVSYASLSSDATCATGGAVAPPQLEDVFSLTPAPRTRPEVMSAIERELELASVHDAAAVYKWVRKVREPMSRGR